LRIAKDIYLVGGGDIGLSSKMDCHVYLIDGGREKCLIDAGVGLETQRILENMTEDGFDPHRDVRSILITHAHADHAGGTKSLREATGAEVLAPEVEAEFIEKGGGDLEAGLRVTKNSGVYPKDYVYQHSKVDRVVRHGDKIEVGKYTLKAIRVEGHSHGTTAYMIEEAPRSLFSSDIVFIGGTIGLGNWPGCDLGKYRENIVKLAGLSIVSLFPGHFMWTLRDGQSHLDKAVKNFEEAWVPPAWTHMHPHR
jgi:glyoxylase-like metal-dependent hydrolase (beta-lactamase superfamily II)